MARSLGGTLGCTVTHGTCGGSADRCRCAPPHCARHRQVRELPEVMPRLQGRPEPSAAATPSDLPGRDGRAWTAGELPRQLPKMFSWDQRGFCHLTQNEQPPCWCPRVTSGVHQGGGRGRTSRRVSGRCWVQGPPAGGGKAAACSVAAGRTAGQVGGTMVTAGQKGGYTDEQVQRPVGGRRRVGRTVPCPGRMNQSPDRESDFLFLPLESGRGAAGRGGTWSEASPQSPALWPRHSAPDLRIRRGAAARALPVPMAGPAQGSPAYGPQPGRLRASLLVGLVALTLLWVRRCPPQTPACPLGPARLHPNCGRQGGLRATVMVTGSLPVSGTSVVGVLWGSWVTIFRDRLRPEGPGTLQFSGSPRNLSPGGDSDN